MTGHRPDPCATCDRPEDAHAATCAMHPRNWGRDAILSDLPGTATLDRELWVCMAGNAGRCDITDDPLYAGHRCTHDDGHDGPHECPCGHQWGDDDA